MPTRIARRLLGRGLVSAGIVLVPAVLGLGLSDPTTAYAADVNEATTVALKRFDAGRKAFEAKKYDEALTEFQASNELSPSPNSKLYIGRCYKALGRIASAYTSLRLAAREAQDRLSASGEKRYSATRDAANAEAAELETQVPRLTLVVAPVVPEGFALKVNGKDIGKASWGVAVETDPGPVTIEASAPRYAPFKQALTLAATDQKRVPVALERLPTATLAVTFRSRPTGMDVTEDGAPIDANVAEQKRDVDVGSHTVVVRAPGYQPFTWTQTLANGDAGVVNVEFKPEIVESKGLPKWFFFSVAGVAVVSEGVATGLAVSAKSRQNTELAKPQQDRSPSTASSIHSEATIANVLFIAGGVIGLGAVALAFPTKWKAEADSPPAPPSQGVSFKLDPWFDRSGGGMGAHGTF